MIPAERQRKILFMLKSQQVVSIVELADLLDVSHMTVRRDIEKLEKQGRVNSVSGGVQLTEVLHSELSRDMKIMQFSHQKEQIGKLAVDLISPNSTVYLDAGTTSLEVAHQLSNRGDLVIITNDFSIATLLMAHSSHEIYHTGGKADRDNQSTVGPKVADFLLDMNIDIAFISTSSWSLRGLSTPNENKITVKRAIAKVSKKVCLISDSSKYGKIATFHALDIEKIDLVLTDANLSDNATSDLQDKGVEVIRSDD
ncbi:DeoR/GlpR transcriptional regulator [Psychromonas sp. B3M02]|uniref:DeoR/GlpR family DNA-binding transcription regulator n=1 Tax=unclassified Psychromonas TaxID=2614957 RepID=UPI000DE9EACF|nr:DeoR/GlpR family DNA-binding transcription regulator [Psychromonas sp. B3M02]RBW41533.1 DeoR/GlpR transcriptional regulator [Psychromonas sp. B3M02]